MVLKLDVERFNLRKLSELKVRKYEQYQIKISNSFADWRTCMIARTYRGLGKTLKRISKPQLELV